MSISAATIIVYLLAHPGWLDRDLTREQRAPLVQRYAEAIRDAAHSDVEVAELLALARHEAAFSVRIGSGHCRPHECDHGRSRGWFQLKAEACGAAYEFAAGSDESIRAEAKCAIALLRFHGRRCREHSETPLFGSFAGYSGAGCHWLGAAPRVLSVRRIGAELAKVEAKS